MSLQRTPPAPHISTSLDEETDLIEFLHPGYSRVSNRLFALPRVDPTTDSGNATRRVLGVHHLTALVACQIIANNAFKKGRLCLDADGCEPVLVPLHGVLVAPKYYFVIDGNRKSLSPFAARLGTFRLPPILTRDKLTLARYPIVPSFQDWEFPHDRIPKTWPIPSDTETQSETSRLRRPLCSVTNSGLALDDAHVLPRDMQSWFNQNGMSKYGSELRDIDNEKNIVCLRVDVHRCFDARWFAIVPKPRVPAKVNDVSSYVPAGGASYVVHALSDKAESAELHTQYHNVVVQRIDHVSRHYLFARFAWAILIRIKPFLLQNVTRRVVQFRVFVDSAEAELRESDLDGKALDQLYGAGKSKSASPRKRKLDEGGSSAPADGDDLDHTDSGSGRRHKRGRYSDSEVDSSDEAFWHTDARERRRRLEEAEWYDRNCADNEPRGRTRTRTDRTGSGARISHGTDVEPTPSLVSSLSSILGRELDSQELDGAGVGDVADNVADKLRESGCQGAPINSDRLNC